MHRRFWLSLPKVIAHPVRLLPLAFLSLIVVGTGLLMLPFAHSGEGWGDFMPAVFTSVSAATVTGLSTVDVATYWTPAGQGIILALVQVGGLGIMTLSTLLGLFIGGRLGLRTRLIAQAEMHAISLGEVRPLLRRIIVTMVCFEAILAVVLTIRFRILYFDDLPTAIWHGVFHSVMAFNNAGFGLQSDNLIGYAGDAWIIFPICVAIIAGGIGYPVLAELFRGWRKPGRWTIHTRLTVWGTLMLLAVGSLAFAVAEWRNSGTIGSMGIWHKVVSSIEGGVMPRTAGFNSVDYANVSSETLGFTTILMFIGGGSAGTAGGIKITTFLLLAYVILAELRGDREVTVGMRSVNAATVRQALTIALLAVMFVATATLLILMMTDFSLDSVLFECVSAFSTVGLSTGITTKLPANAQAVLMALMFIGKVGTITAASALLLRSRVPRYHLPEERPIIG